MTTSVYKIFFRIVQFGKKKLQKFAKSYKKHFLVSCKHVNFKVGGEVGNATLGNEKSLLTFCLLEGLGNFPFGFPKKNPIFFNQNKKEQ